MALSPIQMFQDNGSNSIEGLLRAGPGAISNIMNQAISLGRSMADKQMAQEQDLLNMRQQETALAQRRAEQAQNVFTDTMKFNRDVVEDNRDFAADREDAAFDKQRLTANDLFSQQMDQRRLGLSEKKLGMVSAEAETERQRGIDAANLFKEKYGGGDSDELMLPVEGGMEPNPEIIANEKLARDETNMIDARSLFGVKDEAADTRSKNIVSDVADQNPRLPELVPSTASDMFNPEEGGGVLPPRNELASVEAKLEMLEKPPEGASEKALTNFFEEKSLLEQRRKELTATDKGDAPKADKGISPASLARQDKAMENTVAFPLQAESIAKKYGSYDKAIEKAKTDEAVAAELKEAQAWDTNRRASETSSAMSMSEEEYVKKSFADTPKEREERRKFYREVREAYGAGATGSTTTGGNPVDSTIDLLLKKDKF